MYNTIKLFLLSLVIINNRFCLSVKVDIDFDQLKGDKITTDSGAFSDTSDPYPILDCCYADHTCVRAEFDDWEKDADLNPDWSGNEPMPIPSGLDDWVYFRFCVFDYDPGANPDDFLGCTRNIEVSEMPVQQFKSFNNLPLTRGVYGDGGSISFRTFRKN